MKESDCVSHSVMSNSVQPHGEEPTKLFCPWDSPGKNTGVVCYVLLQIFPTQHLYIYTYKKYSPFLNQQILLSLK